MTENDYAVTVPAALDTFTMILDNREVWSDEDLSHVLGYGDRNALAAAMKRAEVSPAYVKVPAAGGKQGRPKTLAYLTAGEALETVQHLSGRKPATEYVVVYFDQKVNE